DVAAGTLRYLARRQADSDDPAREAEPGKIMHELRFGELTGTGKTPHSPYYGSWTPRLCSSCCGGYRRATGDDSLLTGMRSQREAALAWLVERGDVDGDGLIELGADAEGTCHLGVQSWRHSN